MGITHQFLATTTLSVATQTITFSNIPQSYNDLVLKLYARGNRPGFQYQDVLGVLEGFADSMYGIQQSNNSSTPNYSSIGDRFWFIIPASNSNSTPWSNNEMYIHNYSSSTTNKMLQIDEGRPDGSITNGNSNIVQRAYIFARTNAITSISFNTQTDAFVAGTNATLYGIKRA